MEALFEVKKRGFKTALISHEKIFRYLLSPTIPKEDFKAVNESF